VKSFFLDQARDIIPHMAQLLKNQKAPGVRFDVSRYIEAIMTRWPESSMQKHQGILEESFKIMVHDASAEVNHTRHAS